MFMFAGFSGTSLIYAFSLIADDVDVLVEPTHDARKVVSSLILLVEVKLSVAFICQVDCGVK